MKTSLYRKFITGNKTFYEQHFFIFAHYLFPIFPQGNGFIFVNISVAGFFLELMIILQCGRNRANGFFSSKYMVKDF